ncbi:MAG: (d)CMP kinase [Longimicrobiales bacterium]
MTAEREGPVVTLDGPAGSGKSSTAREVARRLGFRHLDSGALYRAVTFALLEAGVPEEEWAELAEADFRALGVHVTADGEALRVRLGDKVLGPELRTPQVTALASPLARIPAARSALLDLQRQAGERGRLVADGRDMGTVVFPHADVKVFLVADLRERARRRLLEQGAAAPTEAELDAEAARIAERDARDAGRAVSPLRRPDDAVDLDTTRLGFEEQVRAVVDLVRARTRP